ncbi:MAG: TIGR03576 family pyridoxal phosphate-dependent enzyme [Methanobacteriaceae archaeon]
MIIENSGDEVKKRESALRFINDFITNNNSQLYDLTGLAGGFLANNEDLALLETYVGSAIFESELEVLGKEHLGGEKVLALNRTSSGLLASILALVNEGDHVVHFLAEFPSHPSIPRSLKLINNTSYSEFDNIGEFSVLDIPDNTSIIIITGSTMDHKVLSETDFEKIVSLRNEKEIATGKKIPILVDDASGARLRVAVYNQKRAIDYGANLVVTSTDKLMQGPRGGLMAGDIDLINLVKSKAHQFGLEAQAPTIMAIVNALKVYNSKAIIDGIEKKDNLAKLLSKNFNNFEKTPTGLMINEKGLKKEIESRICNNRNSDNNNNNVLNIKCDSDISDSDYCFLFSMILLKKEGIITIPAVSMPGASNTIRFDLASKDALHLDLNTLNTKIISAFNKLIAFYGNRKEIEEILFN